MDSAKVARLLSDLMQTPRVEWFVSKGQRLPIGQPPPDVTGARLLLAFARLAEFSACLRQLQSQPGQRRRPRGSAPGAAGEGGASAADRAPKPGASVPDTTGLEPPGWGLLSLSPLAPCMCSEAIPSAFKASPPFLDLGPPIPLQSHGRVLSPWIFLDVLY